MSAIGANRWLESRSFRRTSSGVRVPFSELSIYRLEYVYFFFRLCQLKLRPEKRHWDGEVGKCQVSDYWLLINSSMAPAPVSIYLNTRETNANNDGNSFAKNSSELSRNAVAKKVSDEATACSAATWPENILSWLNKERRNVFIVILSILCLNSFICWFPLRLCRSHVLWVSMPILTRFIARNICTWKNIKQWEYNTGVWVWLVHVYFG